MVNKRVYNPSKRDEEMIKWQIQPFAPDTPIAGPVELSVYFFLPIPPKTGRRLREQMINRVILPDHAPDVDNLAYIVTNALKKLVYDDDKRVCALHMYKFYGETPKTVVRVRPILQAQPLGLRDADDI